MKTQRRHELQQNDLADFLAKWIETGKPYSRAIVGGGLLVCVVLFALTFMRSRNRSRLEESWNGFYVAATERDADELLKIAEKYTGTTAAVWARQTAADAYLARGTRYLYRDRDEAEEELEKAKEAYEAVVVAAPDDSMLKQRALFGLGQAHESLNDLDIAVEQYEMVAKQWPDSTFGKQAEQRIEYLQLASTREFYKWFFEQEPKTPEIGADRSSLYDMLPSDPDIGGPSLPPTGDGLDLPSLEDALNTPLEDVNESIDPTEEAPTTTDPIETTEANDRTETDDPVSDPENSEPENSEPVNEESAPQETNQETATETPEQ